MDPISDSLQGIHRKVDKLLGVVGRLEAERARLLLRQAELEDQLAANAHEMEDLQTRLAVALSASASHPGTDAESPERAVLRTRIEELLGQIDECLRLMNE
jgi:hypothetical protein